LRYQNYDVKVMTSFVLLAVFSITIVFKNSVDNRDTFHALLCGASNLWFFLQQNWFNSWRQNTFSASTMWQFSSVLKKSTCCRWRCVHVWFVAEDLFEH